MSVILTGQLLSCLWVDLADTLVEGRGRSWLPSHQVAPKSATSGRPNRPPVGAVTVKKVLFLSCLWADLADTGMVRVGHGYLATR